MLSLPSAHAREKGDSVLTTANAPITRARGRLTIHADATLFYRGHEVKALGLTSDPTMVLVRTDESKDQHAVASQDFVFVMTGLEQISGQMAKRWFKAYLLTRSMLSELVELFAAAPEEDRCSHSVCLVESLVEQAESFREAVRQAGALLRFLPLAASVHPGEAAHLFAACLITTGRLETMLERSEEARLAPHLERIPDGARFLNALGRAHHIIAQISELMGEETAAVTRHPTHAQLWPCFTFLLCLWSCLSAWWWLRQYVIHHRWRLKSQKMPKRYRNNATNHH